MVILHMDSDVLSLSKHFVECWNCGSSCSSRSVKRKYEQFEEGDHLFLTGIDCVSTARLQVESECDVLREMVSKQQQSIQDLYAELEEERNASASAANEAMSMIMRLQREKSDIHMEARQFKRFAEEKMAHDHQEISCLEDVLYRNEEMIQSLSCEVQAYKHRMISYGLTEAELESLGVCPESSIKYLDSQFDSATYKYPPLICDATDTHGPLEEGGDDRSDIEKYAFDENPTNREYLKKLESRISQLEGSPSYSRIDGDVSSAQNVVEKIIIGHSPRETGHSRKLSSDSSGSQVIKELGPDLTETPRLKRNSRETEFVSQIEEKLRRVDIASEAGDDMSDRFYTIDSAHNGPPSVAEGKTGGAANDEFVSPPKESSNYADISSPDIQKLYMRLQALEAERESMRQAVLSIRTDKVQLILLKEIAQRLCNEVSPEQRMSSKKMPVLQSFSFVSVCKWMVSFVFSRKKSHRNKHALRLSGADEDEGLSLILDKCPRMRQWRCLTSTQLPEPSLCILASKFTA